MFWVLLVLGCLVVALGVLTWVGLRLWRQARVLLHELGALADDLDRELARTSPAYDRLPSD